MGKKGKNATNGKSGGNADLKDLEQKTKLQAVVFADSFTQQFRPVTLETPKVLLPLVNVPMIDYTIEFLAGAGVEEIHVFARSHCDQVQQHLSQSKFARMETLKIEVHQSQEACSEGDVLRFMGETEKITSDFILIHGDVVSNMDLGRLMKEHESRLERDKKSIMTMVFKKTPPSCATRSSDDDNVVALNLDNHNQLVMFKSASECEDIKVPTEVLKGRTVVQMRYDLMDCHICVCSPEVLEHFKEEFDYQSIREDFLKGVLQDLMEDNLHDYKIHAHVLDSEYAARITDLRSYDAVSKDIVRRWAYPIVPENNLFLDTSYQSYRGGIYKEADVQVDRACRIGKDTVIGKGTRIGPGSSVKGSVLGRNVVIGSNVEVENSYIWDGAVLDDGCTVTHALVCANATVGKNSQIQAGAVVSYGCAIGEGFVLGRCKKVTTQTTDDLSDDSSDDEDQAKEEAPKVVTAESSDSGDVGRGGIGRLWEPDEPDEDMMRCIGASKPKVQHDSSGTESSDESDESEEVEEPDEWKFQNEAVATVERGYQDGFSVDNISLEIKSLKYAYNSSFGDCANAVLRAILAIGVGKNPKTGFSKVLKEAVTAELFSNFRTSSEKLDGKIKTQVDLLCAAEAALERPEFEACKGVAYLNQVLYVLYENDIVEEDACLEWEQRGGANVTVCEPFLNWLKEAESDDESDEE